MAPADWKSPLGPGEEIEVRIASGPAVTLVHRVDEDDYRVTVMIMDRHIERPRHFTDEQRARNHARHLVSVHRRDRNDPFTWTIRRRTAAA